MSKRVFITTTLPYVNNDPHVGFAMEIIRADALARYYKLSGHEVFFNTGTDEHGQKLLADAEKAGKDVKDYVDFYAEKFRGLKDLLGITDDVHFVRTTDEHHVKAAQSMWQRVKANGYIYKKQYQAKYCVGCELEKTDSELVDGKCPIHPNKDIELIDEENYFFAFSKLEGKLKDLYAKNDKLVIPEFRFNEMKAFLDRGLQDFSISRLASKMSWGVPVPGDSDHVMYVWFDALTNYVSTLGWPEDTDGDYKKFWEEGLKIQYCGKDNVRQQSMMWQAILLAANLPNTDHVIINGFINSGGQKMSKSLGNVINPYDLIEEYKAVAGDLSSDVLRYYLLRHMNSFEDSDMTLEGVLEAYNSGLANGLGNLVSRIMALSEKYCEKALEDSFLSSSVDLKKRFEPLTRRFEKFEVKELMDDIWSWDVTNLDRFISGNEDISSFEEDIPGVNKLDKILSDYEPFKKIKTDPVQGKRLIAICRMFLYKLAIKLEPFMPKTSAEIKRVVLENKKPEKPLFLRKD